MYAKCGSMILAQGVFDSMIRRDAISWNSLILGYAENGQNLHALEVFACMDCDRSSVTFVGATMAVKNLACEDQSRRGIFLERGILIHQQARELGFESDIVVASSFIDMYAKCGGMFLAREVFDSMKRRNVVTWNSLIWGYIENGELSVALDLFANHMNCEPSYVTFVAVLKAVGLSAKANESLKKFYYEKGLEIHKKIRERRLDSNIVVANTLIDMYSKCGSVENAKEVFDKIVDRDVVAWNSMISGYTENGENLRAIDLFLRINCKPSSATYLSVLKACASLASDDESRKQFCLENGILIHQQVIDDNLESDVSVSTALIDMYSKCGSMQNARDVFKKMVHPDVVTWTSLISGFVENGENLQALEVFSAMDCEADAYAYVAALKACECLATLDSGKKIHNRLCRVGLEQDQVVAAALVNFYMKCGTLRKAEEIFYSMKCPDVVSWNTMITGYSSHGKHSQLFELAKQMKDGGVQMNIITYSCIFMACSHMGLVAEGRLCFEAMVHRCGIASLNANHYNCMVDLLCRANMLEEALAIIRGMPQSSGGADAVIWRTLLGACKKWRNLEIANVAFGALVAAGSKDSADYILMSDIYASFSL